MINRFLFILFITTAGLAFAYPVECHAQNDGADQIDPRELDEYKENATYILNILEQYFNIVGDSSTPFSEKKVIFTESWQKLFRDSKVQVEDDLDPERKHIIYKDITAYLKDIDFFFNHIVFEFEAKEVTPLLNDKGQLFLNVAFNQKYTAIDIDGDTIKKDGERFIEIYVNRAEQDLKIVSIYTNKVREQVNLMHWWKQMSPQWQKFFSRQVLINDSIYLSDLINSEDSLDIENDILWIYAGNDSLKTTADTLYFKDDKIQNQLRKIIQSESVSISGDSTLSKLDALHVFSNLRQLDISNTSIQDLSPIRHFTDLRYLNASQSLVYDISPLQYNSGLKYLDLSFTLVEDLGVLNRFINLELLDLSNTRPNSLEGIEYLSRLKELELANMQLPKEEYNRIQYLHQLDYLKLSHSNILDLSPVGKLSHLTRLDIRNTEVTDITPLSSCEELKVINLEGAPLSSLLPLLVLPKIEKIYCDNTRISKKLAYDFMSKRPGTLVIHNSKYLIQWWMSLSDEWKNILAPQAVDEPGKEELQEIASQGKVDISGRKDIASIDALEILENLTYLDISNTSVDNLTPLSGLRNLKFLDFSNTQISNLTPLILCSKLEQIKMESTPVHTLIPLKTIHTLKVIYADSTNISSESIDSLVLNSKNELIILYNTDFLSEWWNNLDDMWKHILADPVDQPIDPGKLQLHKILNQRTFRIEGNRKITYLEPLKRLRFLKELYIKETSATELSPLKKLVYLEKLSITDSPLKDISYLKNLVNLVFLDLSNTPVEDLEAISALSEIRELKLSGTGIRNLKYISDLENLEEFDCSNTNIRSLREIENLPNLKNINCYNTRISDRYIETFKAEHHGTKIIYY